ncbi:MAG: DedA family protein [Candidatus Paceibacterota bacterium]
MSFGPEQLSDIGTFAGHLSYLGIFLSAIFSGGITFFPEEIVLITAGYVSSTGSLNLYAAVLVCVVAMILSDTILFGLARRNNKHIKTLRYYAGKVKITRNLEFVRAHLKKFVFVAKFLPLFRFVGPIMAGTLKMKPYLFQIYNLFAIVLYTLLYAGIGYIFHSQFLVLVSKFENVRHGIFVFVMFILGVASYIFVHNKIDRWLDENTPEEYND